MARNSSGLTLGFLGKAEFEPDNGFALLEDLLNTVPEDAEIKFYLPITEDLFTGSLEEIGNWLYEHEVPYEAITDENTPKEMEDWIRDATKTHKVADVITSMVNLLEKAPNPALVILWEDDDEVSEPAALQAQEKGVKSLDLMQGLEVIELQVEGEGGGDEPGGEEEEPEPYTREELEALTDIEELKKILEANELEMPPPRSKKSTYIDIILKAQDEALGAEGEPDSEDDNEAPAQPERAGREDLPDVPTEGAVILDDSEWDALRDMTDSIIEELKRYIEEEVVKAIKNLDRNIVESLTSIRERLGSPSRTIDAASEERPPSTGPRKAVGATKKAAPAGGMSEAQAQKIIDEWGGRRGRPTAEVAEARKVLGLDQPQPSRPVGRPRKST